MDIKVKEFGKMPNGKLINTYQLENDKGIIINIINYGGIITHILTPDPKGITDDIVLGFDNLQDYLAPHPYLGAIIGRYANRIGNASFSLDGKKYKLTANEGQNHLHGGSIGFDKTVWLAFKNISTEFISVKMAYESPDGEESYPGNLMVEVEYILNNQNELVINYTAQTDKKTHINLTNHSYFNLNGMEKDIHDHILQIDSDYITENNETQIPTGNLIPVKNTAFDFSEPKKIGRDISSIESGYDNNFVINGYSGHLRKCAFVEDPLSGRTMEVLTTQPAVQLYTTNSDPKITGKKGIVYQKHSAFCLETQHYPDSPNKESFPSTILNPGETYTETTIYRFGHTRKN
jgi:aldose 1-epimerase